MNPWCLAIALGLFAVLVVNDCAKAQAKPWDEIASGEIPVHQDRTACGCDEMPCASDRLSPCERAGSLWSATADALFLDRSNPDSAVLAVNTDDPVETFNADSFNFGTHTGFDLSLTRAIGKQNALELRYFGIDGWHSTVSSPTTPGDLLQINAAVPVFTFTGDAANADYRTQLHNAEFNGRHQVSDWFELIAGFRYAELDERLSASLVNAAVPFDYQTSTRNHLYGFQLGGQTQLIDTRLLLFDVTGKAGVFGNHAAQDGSISTGAVTSPVTGQGDSAAFIGELALTGAVRMTDHLSLRGGYRLLWLDGLALASEQLAVSNFAQGTGFDDGGDVFYHGATAGLELSY